MRVLLVGLIHLIAEGLLPGSRALPYQRYIHESGGAEAVAEKLYEFIDPDIKKLQNCKITPSALDHTLTQQGLWMDREMHTGYCDYITDDRDPDYFRLYIGQTNNSVRRVVLTHAQCILRGEYSSLHYFILWMGNGHRAANFLRLWSFSQQADSESSQLRNNILESLFCRAFGSHYGSLAPEVDDSPAGTGFGLNIMSPLLQNVRMASYDRALYVPAIKKSGDPQIRAWLNFRQEVKAKQKARFQRPIWSKDDYRRALQESIQDDAEFKAIEQTLNYSHSHADQILPPSGLKNVPYYGSLSAGVGFVLDFALATFGLDQVEESHDGAIMTRLPWALAGSKFTANNVLVWTFDFRPFSSVSSEKLSALSSIQQDPELKENHIAMLQASHLKVVVLCGPTSKDMILSTLSNYQHYKINIRGCTLDLVVSSDHCADGITRRLFVCGPQLPSQIWSVSVKHAATVSEIIKFSSLVSKVGGIRPYFFEGCSALSLIVRQREREKRGSPEMTTETIDEGLYLWLSRKGFSNRDDIAKLESIAGSLTKGLIVLAHVLPRRPRVEDATIHTPRVWLGQKKRPASDPLDREVYDAAKKHCQSLIREHASPFRSP